jgi:hypothetical protein
MGTYNANLTMFTKRLNDAVAAFQVGGVGRLIVGLETTQDDGPGVNKPYSADQLTPRFAAIAAAGVSRIGIWSLPITDAWWPFLHAFHRGSSGGGGSASTAATLAALD